MDAIQMLQDFHESRCLICKPGARYPASCYTFPFPPASAQSLAKKSGATLAYRTSIQTHLERNKYQTPVSYKSSVPINTSILQTPKIRHDVCVGLLFVYDKSSHNQDLDNSAKAFLDAIKGNKGLITDDMQVIHLDCHKRVNENAVLVKIPSGITNPAFVSCTSFVAVRISVLR